MMSPYCHASFDLISGFMSDFYGNLFSEAFTQDACLLHGNGLCDRSSTCDLYRDHAACSGAGNPSHDPVISFPRNCIGDGSFRLCGSDHSGNMDLEGKEWSSFLASLGGNGFSGLPMHQFRHQFYGSN